MLANYPRLMAKSEEHVAKLIDSVAVIKVTVGVKRAGLMSLIKTTMNLLEHLQPVIEIRQKLEISLKLVKVNFEILNDLIIILKKKY